MTWIEKLREALPNSFYVRYIESTMRQYCPYRFFGGNAPYNNECDARMCVNCWNSEVK